MIDQFTNKIHQGNSLDILKQMPDSSVDSVITSPAYWMLRDYGYDGQWGLEATYQEYLEHLWQFVDETYRILKPAGTAWINLADTYGTTSGNLVQGNLGTNKIKYTGKIHGYNKPAVAHKCLLLLPHRFAIGCIDRGWIIRNVIIWAKKNGMPESVIDRFSKKHEYFFFMVKQKKYYFDLDEIRQPNQQKSIERYKRGYKAKFGGKNSHTFAPKPRDSKRELHPNGKNPGDVSDFWDINTKGTSTKKVPKKHYASYNFKLIEKPIVAGSPEGGIILDPFCGIGTTLVRALQLGRRVIGIDGSEQYVKIAREKINKELNQLKIFA